MKNARAQRAKLLFLLIKYAKFVTFSLPSRRVRSLNSLIILRERAGYEVIDINQRGA